jgi:hypothetical protein
MARRNAGTVRTIMGVRGIAVRSLGVKELAGSELFGGNEDLINANAWPPSRRRADEACTRENQRPAIVRSITDAPIRTCDSRLSHTIGDSRILSRNSLDRSRA